VLTPYSRRLLKLNWDAERTNDTLCTIHKKEKICIGTTWNTAQNMGRKSSLISYFIRLYNNSYYSSSDPTTDKDNECVQYILRFTAVTRLIIKSTFEKKCNDFNPKCCFQVL